MLRDFLLKIFVYILNSTPYVILCSMNTSFFDTFTWFFYENDKIVLMKYITESLQVAFVVLVFWLPTVKNEIWKRQIMTFYFNEQ